VTEQTRSATAQGPVAAAAVERRRRAQPNGWWGMALFLCAEATLFGSVIATYFYLDFNSRHWPPPGIERPSVILPFLAPERWSRPRSPCGSQRARRAPVGADRFWG
jgi:heme/copper-type cytochrome/quinol oxidase subunit 3